jgi:hypothetical protein
VLPPFAAYPVGERGDEQYGSLEQLSSGTSRQPWIDPIPITAQLAARKVFRAEEKGRTVFMAIPFGRRVLAIRTPAILFVIAPTRSHGSGHDLGLCNPARRSARCDRTYKLRAGCREFTRLRCDAHARSVTFAQTAHTMFSRRQQALVPASKRAFA